MSLKIRVERMHARVIIVKVSDKPTAGQKDPKGRKRQDEVLSANLARHPRQDRRKQKWHCSHQKGCSISLGVPENYLRLRAVEQEACVHGTIQEIKQYLQYESIPRAQLNPVGHPSSPNDR